MSKYDKMCYTEFTSYLRENKIEFIEDISVDIDVHFTEYQIVTPIESKLKERYFDRDGGGQIFY